MVYIHPDEEDLIKIFTNQDASTAHDDLLSAMKEDVDKANRKTDFDSEKKNPKYHLDRELGMTEDDPFDPKAELSQ